MDINNFNLIPSVPSPHKLQKIPLPLEQAIFYSPKWTKSLALEKSHVITYRESCTKGELNAYFEFKPVKNVFWTGLRASWTRNVPAKFRITAISNVTNMKYELYEFQEIPICTWIYLPSLIPAINLENYTLLLEFIVPIETLSDTCDCDLIVKMIGFEDLIDVSRKNYCLKSINKKFYVGVYDVDGNNAKLLLPCCDTIPNLEPNYIELPQHL